MNEELREELLAMVQVDLAVRQHLLDQGALEEGYHPSMEHVHRLHAERFEEILAQYGRWPGRSDVGEDGGDAAWLIVQHAIGHPTFQRRGLELLREAIDAGEAPAWQAAYLDDRIRVFEGRPQRYGTQFDRSQDGSPIPFPIEDPEDVDERRGALGLDPMAERLAKQEHAPPMSDADWRKRQRDAEAWRQRVGWQ